MKITDIEWGDHFVTFYGDDKKGILDLGTLLWRNLPQEYQKNQRRNLAHLPGDVPVFHKQGNPIELGKENPYHFHILFTDKPTEKQISYMLQKMQQLDKNITICNPVPIRKL